MGTGKLLLILDLKKDTQIKIMKKWNVDFF